MPVRVALLFSLTTDPSDRGSASPHSGGWSESFFIPGNAFQPPAFFTAWGQSRSGLLAGEATISGYRQQLVTISGNKLIPGGTAGGVLNIPGSFGSDLSAPQAALMVNFAVAAQPQNLRHRLAGIPKSQVTGGEYQPTTAMKAAVTKYTTFVSSGIFEGVVRDLTQPDARVKGLAAGVLTTISATGAAQKDYIRLRRVKDDSGNPVEGSFLVLAVVVNADTTVSYTLFGAPAQAVSTPNGTARKDLLAEAIIQSGAVNRLVARKIGRPFVLFRGRRSKRRV